MNLLLMSDVTSYKSENVCVVSFASVEILQNTFHTKYENELMVSEVCEKTLQKRERLTGRCQEKNNRIHSQSSVGIQRFGCTCVFTVLSYCN